MVIAKRLLTFAAYAALGPITGPCVAGFVRNLRGGAPVLACLYLVAGAAVLADLGLLQAHLIQVLAR